LGKRLLYILALVALMPISLIFFYPYYQVAQAQATGWLEGWKYRRAVTIDNTLNSNALTDYQVLVVVDTASLISAGKLQDTCADIRFTDSDGTTLLNYWIEPGTCNTPSTRIWVKVPSIPASSTKTIYLYYGNSTVGSVSNPKATLVLYDDFATLDASTWYVVRGSTTLLNPGVEITGTGEKWSNNVGGAVVRTTTSYGIGLSVMLKVSVTNRTRFNRGGVTLYVDDNNYVTVKRRQLDTTTSWTMHFAVEIGRSVPKETNPSVNINPVWVRLDWYGNGVFDGYYSSDGVTWTKIDTYTYTSFTSMYIALEVDAFSGYSAIASFYEIRARKYIPPDPTTSVSTTEESYVSPPTLSNPSDGSRVGLGASVNFTWTYNPAFSGDYQSAFQLQISNSTTFTTLFYDTGQVSSGNTYVVITLPSNMTVGTYYWRVRVWSSTNLASVWSSAYKLIVDVIVVTLSVNDTRTDVGSYVNISWVLKFKSDNTPITSFSITVNRNGTSWYSGSLSYALDTSLSILAYTYDVASVKDGTYGVTTFEANTVTAIWDQVVVNSITPTKQRFTVGETAGLSVSAVYAYDNAPFQGSFTFNDTLTKTSVGLYTYAVASIMDNLYGLTKFTGNTTVSVIFDKLIVDSYSFRVNDVALGNNTRVDYTSPLNITAVLKHAYDGLILNSTNAVKVQLAGVDASWNGSAWVATVQPPGAITAVGHSVVSYAESTLGVRFVDSVVFRVIYDSVNATYYTSDLAGNTVTLKLVYGYDGALVPSGTVCVNDFNTVVCGSISNGYATLGFNRFTNGTVSFVNATDGAFVFSNPVKPDKLAVKWASSDGKISLVGTVDAYYYNHTELPGYFRLACELKGNASVYVNTSLSPVLVKVNGTPVGFSYVNGVVVLYNLSSTVEAYYSTLVSASTLPGAAPAGVVYEIGFADNSTLEQSVLRIGVLVNGSSVVPFVYYNGSVFYASGVSGLSYPLDVVVSWECSNGVVGVDAMVVYMLGKYTYYSTLRSVFSGVNVSSCPSKLYPYLYIPGDLTGVVDKYGGLSSEVLRFLATGALRINVAGPIPAGGLVKYVTLASPVRIVYSAGNVYTEPGSGSMLTLVGFRGFTLSYSVAGASVSNILIARDEYPLDFPRGISLLVIADPSSKTVSLVQVSPVSEPREYMPIPVPGITVPALPNPQPPVFPGSWDSPAFTVLYGATVAVAIVATRITGSVPRGIMVAAMSFGLVLLGIGVFTRDFSAVSVALVALVTAVGVEVARRQAS